MKKQFLCMLIGLMLIVSSSCTILNLPEANPPEENITDENLPGENPAEENVTEEKLPDKINVTVPSGATAISIAKPMKDTLEFNSVPVNYEVVPTTDLIVARLTAREADFAIVPVNLAAQLYQKKLPYKLTSVVTWGNLFIASAENLEGWEALRGKDIYLMGKSLVPDIVFRTLLKTNGLDPDKDMNLIYLSGATELAPNFLSGKAEISMLPEPVLTTVTMKKSDTHIMLDLQEEWNKIYGTDQGYPQAGIFVKEDLINSNPGLVKDYLKVIEEGMTWLNENPEEAGRYAEELELGLPAAVVAKSVPGNNIRHQYAGNVKEELNNFFKILFDFNPETVGGVLPDEGLYYEVK